MQVVIEISSYDKEWITNDYRIPEEINMRISEAIANGTPLDEILNKIRAEIRELTTFDTVDVLVEVNRIINKIEEMEK